MIEYRPEINDLRAIAVMSVIFGHAGFELFSGGFVGVDIFFVISGYLISSIVISQINEGSFSYKNLYERRARRLLPALLVVLIISSVPSYFFMLPDELENYGQSLIATMSFGNNVLLWITSGYWELNSEFKPLLHTWSLGVEEQFYLIFPAIIVFAVTKHNALKAVPIFSGIFIFIEHENALSQTQRLKSEIAQNEMLKKIIPDGRRISWMDLVSNGNYVQLTDESGKLISVDRTHLTKPGSEYMGRLFYKSDHELVGLLVNQ